MKRRVLVAMSGGVDSSVAALLLKREGWEVIGVGMHLPGGGSVGEDGACCGIAGMDDARRVARTIGVPFYVLNYVRLFEQTVVADFCRAYLSGETPNPCVECNRVVKFGHLLRMAVSVGADAVATGHYARLLRQGREHVLLKAEDASNDQTYFLYPLRREVMDKIRFPLGSLRKEEVRSIARSAGLEVWDKRSSTDICFIPNGDYGKFIVERFPGRVRPGPIVDVDGRRIGVHRGYPFYTVGQRRGLGIGGGERLYVVEIRPHSNTIVVGPREMLRRRELGVRRVNWLVDVSGGEEIRCEAVVRFRAPSVVCTVKVEGEGSAVVRLDEPCVLLAAPGQSIVFYDGGRVLGGGIIAWMK